MTRAGWYAQHTGGGWRKARRPFMCGQSLCLAHVMTCEPYFDTCKKIGEFTTLRICTCCAEEELKD